MLENYWEHIYAIKEVDIRFEKLCKPKIKQMRAELSEFFKVVLETLQNWYVRTRCCEFKACNVGDIYKGSDLAKLNIEMMGKKDFEKLR